MTEKHRYTVSLPYHIATEVTKRSAGMGSKEAEYLANIVRWWYGQGSPAINEEEQRVLAEKKTSAKRAS